MVSTKDWSSTLTETAVAAGLPSLAFELPQRLEAGEPPEARGLDRDQVKLMVSHFRDDHVTHTTFRHLPCHLQAGDALVINTSGTMNAAVSATRADGTPLELHLSTRLPADVWSVELRRVDADGSTRPFWGAAAGEQLSLPAGGQVTLLTPHHPEQRATESEDRQRVRLWLATLRLPQPPGDYLAQHGFPIRYRYVRKQWPISYYQTVFANEIGSAEMPSAGRAFSHRLLTELMAAGIQIVPLLLHTGVASLEAHEPPYEEYYRVPAATARRINEARAAGQRIVAVGTTVVRALETVTDESGMTHPGEGWTDVVVSPARGVRAGDGLLTGLHEPKATHLAMLAALAGMDHLRHTYAQALEKGYLWHEFGDLHLILP